MSPDRLELSTLRLKGVRSAVELWTHIYSATVIHCRSEDRRGRLGALPLAYRTFWPTPIRSLRIPASCSGGECMESNPRTFYRPPAFRTGALPLGQLSVLDSRAGLEPASIPFAEGADCHSCIWSYGGACPSRTDGSCLPWFSGPVPSASQPKLRWHAQSLTL